MVVKKKVKSDSNPRVLNASVAAFGRRALRKYADEVNLDRATPDIADGLKPVQRRLVYAASQQPAKEKIKSARLVGDTMGRFHPHGDQSIMGALVTMIQGCTPLVYGCETNWGNLIAPAAAMRYNAARLSNFGRTGFEAHYINKEVTDFVPNYDDKEVEPVTIPFPLPNVLLNGSSGIGYGVASDLPNFTPESVVEILKRLLAGEKLKAADFAKTLKPALRWGGSFVNTKENRAAWMTMFTGTKASVQYESILKVDTAKHTVIINQWPPGLDPEKYIMWVRSLEETQEAYPSKGSMEFTIQMKRGYNSVQFDGWLKKLRLRARVKASYNINVTSRKAIINDGVVDYEVQLLNMSVPQLAVAWLRHRIETEIRSLTYRIKKQNEAIAYSDLMIMAASKLEIIVPIVKKSPKPKEELSKKLKITLEQAAQILELRLRQLTRLDQAELAAKRKEQLAHLAVLSKWLKAPKKKVAADFDVAMEAIVADRNIEIKSATQEIELK